MSNGHTFLRIVPVEDRFATRVEGRGGSHRRPQFATLWLRVGSDEERMPIWAVWPMRMHRPLPEGARVMGAQVSVRKEGPVEKWTVELTVRVPDVLPTRHPRGVVAIDIGWRSLDEECFRIASWSDDAGRHGSLRLTRPFVTSLRVVDGLRKVRDERRNVIREAIADWLRKREDVPEWLLRRTVKPKEPTPSIAQAAAWLSQWQSQARIAALARAWAEHRMAGDEAIFAQLEAWKERDNHLWRWESAQRNQSQRRRLDLYRAWSKRLAKWYTTIVVGAFDRRKIAHNPVPETEIIDRAPSVAPVVPEEDVRSKKARANRHLCCTSSLCAPSSGCLRSAASRYGSAVVTMACEDVTRECPECGLVTVWHAAAHLDRTPPCSCGWSDDQDVGSSSVLLRRYLTRELSSGEEDPATARRGRNRRNSGPPGETRWQRVARLKREKDERMEGSRKLDPNGAK